MSRLYKTRGISLSYLKYKDSSIIARIFTEEFGLQAYIVNGVRSSRSKGKIAVYQPLTALDLVVYRKENANIQRISQIKISHPYHDIPFNLKKAWVGIFLSEVLGKILEQDAEEGKLFRFCLQSFLELDQIQGHLSDFPIQFLLRLSHHLGFQAENEAVFRQEIEDSGIDQKLQIEQGDTKLLLALAESPYDQAPWVAAQKRKDFLEIILAIYAKHYPSLNNLKSPKVLKEVLKEN